MAYVLTTGSSVECGHSGKVATSGAAKLKVNGDRVLQKSGVGGKSVSGCSLKDTSDNSGPLTTMCRNVTTVTAGEATKLKVSGAPVVLDTLAGGTDGMATKGPPAAELRGQAGHSKLKAI